MRHGRAKSTRKTLQFYHRTLGLKPPYHVLLDGTFVMACVKFNVAPSLPERLAKLLQVKSESLMRLCTTQSVVDEIDQLLKGLADRPEPQQSNRHATTGKKRRMNTEQDADNQNEQEQPPPQRQSSARTALQTAKSFLHNCQFIPPGSTASIETKEDLSEHEGSNKRKRSDQSTTRQQDLSTASQHIYHLATAGHGQTIYFIATQDEVLQDILRNVGSNRSGQRSSTVGVPIVRLATRCGCVLLLEPPSSSAVYNAAQQEQQKWKATTTGSTGEAPASVQQAMVEQERILASHVRREQQRQSYESKLRPFSARRKPKAKGPNPLSVKKKKSAVNSAK
jgi:rRNA-processing protein FCF1